MPTKYLKRKKIKYLKNFVTLYSLDLTEIKIKIEQNKKKTLRFTKTNICM